MGLGDVLGAIGDGIGTLQEWSDSANKWLLPSEALSTDPVIDFRGDGGPSLNLTPKGAVTRQQSAVGYNVGLEQAMSGIRWLYSNGIAQPIATAALVGKQDRGEGDFFGGDYFSSSTWSRAWKAANHISPGQAIVMSPDEAQRAIDSPLLYYTPPEAYLPPGFKELPLEEQQRILKDAGMPAVGNAYVEKLRGNSAWYKYGTGAIDFGMVVFMDPTALAISGATRAGRVVTAPYGKSLAGVREIRKPKGGWSAQDIDYMMRSTQLEQLKAGIWTNRNNPQLLNNTELARRSGMGPKFGAIASKLSDEGELDLFIRTGMGDVRAMEELAIRNAGVEMHLKGDTSRLDHLDLMRSRYAENPRMQSLIDAEMARVQRQVNSNQAIFDRYTAIMAEQNTLNRLNVSRWQIQRAEDRTLAQNQYRAGAARPGLASTVARGRGQATTIRPSAPVITSARYRPTPIDSGYVHTRLWGAGDLFTLPVTMVRSLKEMHPNGFINVGTLDKDSLVELRGYLNRVPNMKESTRANIVNAYTRAASETERLDILQDVGRVGAAKVAERYGLDPEIGRALYAEHMRRKGMELANIQRYSAGRRPPEEVAAMRDQAGLEAAPYGTDPLAHVDTFVTQDGQAINLEPFTATRLVNNHTMMDLDLLDKVLARNSGKLQKLHKASGSARDAVESMGDAFNQLWKFTTLFRLGYIPRVLGDELAGQWMRLGAWAMTARTVRGAKNGFDNIARWMARPALEARENTALAGARFAADEIKLLQPQLRALEKDILGREASDIAEMGRAFRRHQAAQAKLAEAEAGPAPATAAQAKKLNALRTFARQREEQLRQVEMRIGAGASPGKQAALARLRDRRDYLQRFHDLQTRAAADYRAQGAKVEQGNQAFEIDGKTFPALFGGKEGEFYRDMFSADQTVGNLLNTNKQLLHGAIQRAFDNGAEPISATQDAAGHLKAWSDVVNNQIMQDAMQVQLVKGATVDEVVRWTKTTGAGRAYRARLPKMVDIEDLVQSAKFEVDQYMHSPELRMKALEPDGVTPQWLEKAFPQIADRPDVHVGRTLQATREAEGALARVREFWFKTVVAQMSDRMSRHPLMNQFYEGHLKTLTSEAKKQGRRVDVMTVREVEEMASAARKLALRDSRELVFDIAHRSDASAAMRFVSPFLSATAESFQRWGRIIADRPEVVGYAANWFNAPAYHGKLQDQDGNLIDQYGYAHILEYPVGPDGQTDYSAKPTVTKRRVPKSERWIVTRMPKWVAESPLGKVFNISEAGSELRLSQNSINIVTQGDPWFNPGVGPIVQIPVNEWVKDKPRQAEVARHLGILPFGVTTEPAFGDHFAGRAISIASPPVVRNFLSAFDTSDSRYQRIKLQIMQREIFEFTEAHDRPPTKAEIGAMQKRVAGKTRDYWLFSAGSAFLQPMATQRSDPYQFFRDQYRALRNRNALTADDEFLARYGESYFVFAQGITTSSGVPATKKAVELQQKYAKEIAENPELAALIIGPEGDGPFSREAYAYQLNNPLVPGAGEMARTKMTADEALEENQRRLGWAKYTARMNELRSKLYGAGFTSFEDEGAESFADEKRAWAMLYSEPLYPDGSENPYYNEQWSRDFLTFDARKYDRLIPGLTAVARSDMAKLPMRSDLRVLQEYLGGRQALIAELNDRAAAGEPATLAAEANADLRYRWALFVDGLIEKDTRFGDLHARYLARDMQVDVEEELEAEEEVE